MEQNERKQSPCLTCTRVSAPDDCESKSCQMWREWFIQRWNELRNGKWNQ